MIANQHSNQAGKSAEQTFEDGYCGSCKSDPCLVSSGAICCHNAVRYGYCNCPSSTWCGFCQHDPCLVVERAICCHNNRQYGYCQCEPVEVVAE